MNSHESYRLLFDEINPKVPTYYITFRSKGHIIYPKSDPQELIYLHENKQNVNINQNKFM